MQRPLPAALGLGALLAAGVLTGCGGSTPHTGRSEHKAAVTPAGAVLPIGHSGRWLTDADGRVLLLHGMNFVSKGVGQTPASDGFGENDAAWLVQNGFDAVRLGTTAASIMPTPGAIDQAYVRSFAATVKMLTAHGLLVLVDLHQDGWGPGLGSDGFPDWMTVTHGATNTKTPFPLYYVTNPAIQAAFQSFWDNDAGPGGTPLQTDTAKIWTALSSSVASDPGVLGYDLINEPWPGTTWAPCAQAGGCATQDKVLDAYDARMTAAIRTQDPEHLLFPEPYVLFNFGTGPTHIGLAGDDPNSGMSWHMYTTDPKNEPADIDFAKQWAARTGGALLNTEFGAVTDVPTIDRMVGELDGALMPWIWWAYNEEVLGDPHKAPTDTDLIQPAAVDALVRPHPVAIAGVPTAQHYDTTSRTLAFSFSTARTSGGPFPCGSVTSFQIPARSYPNGYHVTVTGGAVTSAPGSQHLTVVAKPGATNVTVTVAPDGSTSPTAPSAICTA